MNFRSKQKGVALFMTLLIVSVATLLASEMWFNNSLDISKQFNNRASYQASHYSRGMILWAKDVLRQDFEQNSSIDTRNEPWNQQIAGIPVEDAVISGRLTDLSGKFNLNNMSLPNTEPSKRIFIRLLKNLQMEPSLADKIIDWMDPDSIPLPQGAEDLTYSTRKPYLRTAGQPFHHISELRLIDGVTEDIYQRLKQYVTVLPVSGNKITRINVNTAPIIILKSLDDRIQINYARALYRDANFQTREDFFNHPAIRNYFLGATNIQRQELDLLIDTRSTWFQAHTQVTMERAVYDRFALLLRETSLAAVREWSLTAYD